MITKEIEDICKRALAKWGTEAQKDIMIEEGSELIVELAKLIKFLIKSRRHTPCLGDSSVTYDLVVAGIIGELVDVKLMIIEMETLFIKDKTDREFYNSLFEKKIQRLKERLDK